MIVFLQDRFLPEEEATVSIHDRSFRYGDGLFEAVLVHQGKLFRWPQHFARLESSAAFLQIPLPCSDAEFSRHAQQLITLNGMPEAVLRLQLSRGVGPRGYAPSGEEKPLVVMTLHPAPVRAALAGAVWKLGVSSFRIPAHDALAGHKTCSRLLQVMAATEARARGVEEALLVNTEGALTEGGTSNVFWIADGTVCTPPLGHGALPGVTRAVVLELCSALGVPHAERTIRPEQLRDMDGVFLSLSSRGLVEAGALEGAPLRRSPLTTHLQEAFETLLARECR